MTEETALRLTVDRRGVIDALAKASQALHITAHFMRIDKQERSSITTEIISAYLEALAAGLEQDQDEVLAQQLVPLVVGLAAAKDEEVDIEGQAKVLQVQVEEFIKLIQEAREEEKGRDDILFIPINTDTIH